MLNVVEIRFPPDKDKAFIELFSEKYMQFEYIVKQLNSISIKNRYTIDEIIFFGLLLLKRVSFKDNKSILRRKS